MGWHTKAELRSMLPLVFCLALAGCGGSGDASWRSWVPPDTIALAGIRLQELRATPAYRKLAAQHRVPSLDEFRDQTGIDPDRDIRELVLAYDGRDALWIARGAFPKHAPGKRGSTSVVIVDQDTALAGPSLMVTAAIERHKSGSGGAPGGLVARIDALPRDAQVWAVTNGWTGLRPETLRQMGNAANLDRVLRATDSTSLTADFRTGVHALITADCRSEPDAQNLSAQLNGLLGLLRSVPRKRPDLLRAFNGIQVTQQSRSVKVTLDISADLIERLLDDPRM